MNLATMIEKALMMLVRKFLHLEPPSKPEELPVGAFILGQRTNQLGEATSESITVNDQDRHRHVYVVGSTGSGKTTALLRIFEEDVARCR